MGRLVRQRRNEEFLMETVEVFEDAEVRLYNRGGDRKALLVINAKEPYKGETVFHILTMEVVASGWRDASEHYVEGFVPVDARRKDHSYYRSEHQSLFRKEEWTIEVSAEDVAQVLK